MQPLSDAAVEARLAEGLAKLPLDGGRVLVLVPDGTRSFPHPLFFRLLAKLLRGRVAQLDVIVALGTHPPLSDEAMRALFGLTEEEQTRGYADIQLLNHAWRDPDALALLGSIPADDIAAISGGLLRQELPVRINRLVLDYDQLLVCGPVFPHEVVGFSGGNKYFFPGIAGPDVIDLTHWLGALMTSYAIIGTKNTPVREVINRAAQLIPTPRYAVCSVVTHEGVVGLFTGTPEEAWAEAADLSSQVHIRWLDRPYSRVLAVIPPMYNDLWVGAKGMYKTEPIVADGGEVVLFAPHISDLSVTHGEEIKQIGYHVRDYFTKQWERFKHVHGGILAHSTHVRGSGTFVDGVEHPRVQVTLSSQVPEELCRSLNLGYRDPASIDIEEWSRDPETLVVAKAGEYLYRLKP